MGHDLIMMFELRCFYIVSLIFLCVNYIISVSVLVIFKAMPHGSDF